MAFARAQHNIILVVFQLAKINDFVPISNQLSIKATYAEFFTQTE
jgi:hypothetical protein